MRMLVTDVMKDYVKELATKAIYALEINDRDFYHIQKGEYYAYQEICEKLGIPLHKEDHFEMVFSQTYERAKHCYELMRMTEKRQQPRYSNIDVEAEFVQNMPTLAEEGGELS